MNFSNFVVGSSNQYAHAGCWAVARSPGHAYNPLFIQGSAGLGKTHLLHAIRQHLLSTSNSVHVVSTQRFIHVMEKNDVPFRKTYGSSDILLADDVHVLGPAAPVIQEEFFHIFNTLFESQRQIVLASHRPAGEIAGLNQRLVSRFEWGLTVQIHSPDEEMRLAILRKVQEDSKVVISDEILWFLARHIKTNVRQLQGAWAKICLATQLKGEPLTMFEVREELRDFVSQGANHQGVVRWSFS